MDKMVFKDANIYLYHSFIFPSIIICLIATIFILWFSWRKEINSVIFMYEGYQHKECLNETFSPEFDILNKEPNYHQKKE
ncbi:hypothetical protein HZS_2188 [Henneguya salminicola]|nr:hypothetical protein HZS_2188 [Henneguya salminicola]